MKIGIITMHRVPNFGSALQAYALQHKLFQHGIDNKIIDYIYSSLDMSQVGVAISMTR